VYDRIMDDHGVASCPARMNWSSPTAVVNAAPDWRPEVSDADPGPGAGTSTFVPLDAVLPGR
jgi:hypothetical protein